MDSPDVIRKKIARAVTDSIGVVNYSDEQPGVKNLLDILIAIKGYSKEEVVSLYKGKGYADLKKDVADAIVDELAPIQEKVNNLLKDKKTLGEIGTFVEIYHFDYEKIVEATYASEGMNYKY